MKYGVIIRNVTDLRVAPKFRSERRSQLLFNEPIKIESSQNGYYSIRQLDNYCGWVDEKAVRIVSSRGFKTLRKTGNCLVASPIAQITSIDYDKRYPPFLFYGTRLELAKKTGNYGIVVAAGKYHFEMALKDLLYPLSGGKNLELSSVIIRQAKRFLGVPYLWGGITPFGFDCSGLVKMIYQFAGISLPRDSRDQVKAGRRIESDEVRAGDLRFFKGHVAIAIDRYKIIHSSLGAGGVAINSLNPVDCDFRSDLLKIYLENRRVI